ncbi:uncharacterized protein ATNIH1004_005574 [Aspergillus tanneri]|uniref:RecA family profile 1 domain-containing protein n=1 Tax=Aspergillus tanneri TaxID=1220188 RepID=A0A5M9MQT7_9EURO|nr:uncharacterized protein ATNIH1004_005574 [Aspergillus tanneri]KAA8646899.1 hypothetical protein ATNIH1004_005574 [Aspergillus tanneri]
MNKPDFLGLSSQEPHRVVSFPASQSLHASTASAPRAISTGLPRLDEALCPSFPDDILGFVDVQSKGIPGGHITEVFGPPGVGKTSLALNVVSNALQAGDKVIWIDTGSPLPKRRLRDMLLHAGAIDPSTETITNTGSETAKSPLDHATNLLYFRAQSLPHLLAILLHPPKGFPPESTSLLVIDSISGPFPSYFPNPSELRSRISGKITDKAQIQWLINRKWNVTSDLATHLSRLATIHRMAVLLLNHTHTRIKGQPRATLCPVLAGGTWESNVYARIALYRDFLTEETSTRVRFAEVMKRSGKTLSTRLEDNVVSFLIESESESGPGPTDDPGFTATSRKRKVDEVADSQDEDDSDGEFRWIEDDDAGLLGD